MTDRDPSGDGCHRRDFLRAAGAAGTTGYAGLAGCIGSSGTGTEAGPEALGNYPVDGDTVTFGFNIAQSGPLAATGEAELQGHRLAVKHINEGGGWVGNKAFPDLEGSGLLGKTVETAIRDTESRADPAEAGARELIRDENAIMFSGGSSAQTAAPQQEIAQQQKVPYMATTVMASQLTGKSCSRYAFRQMFNSHMAVEALIPVLKKKMGESRRTLHVVADSTQGREISEVFRKRFTSKLDWQTVGEMSVSVGTTNFESVFRSLPAEVESAGPDQKPNVIVLSLAGLDAANALIDARGMLPDRLQIPRQDVNELEFVVPLFDRPMAETAGDAVEGVYGAIPWDPAIDTPLSNTFKESYKEDSDTDSDPAGPTQIAYTQTLLYADAVARTGTFYPPDVIRELEGHVYAAGMGKEELRACDHQAVRPVPVVKGLSKIQQQGGQFFDLPRQPARKLGYECEEDLESEYGLTNPAQQCSLGDYGDEGSNSGGES